MAIIPNSMIFKITLKVLEQGAQLPLSYQYELSSWIYRLMGSADQPFATWLHNQGYDFQGKRFKLFTFSRLNIPKNSYQIRDDRMEINARFISFRISFLVEKAAETMLLGMFQQQRLVLGDKKSRIALKVEQVELLPLPDFKPITYFRTSSPMVITQKTLTDDKEKYLHPLETDFAQLFWHNIKSKYLQAVNYNLVEPLDLENENFVLKIISSEKQVKSRLITIKAFTPQQTRIRGFLFDFTLKTSPKLLRLGLLAGFGAYCSQGFGSTRILE